VRFCLLHATGVHAQRCQKRGFVLPSELAGSMSPRPDPPVAFIEGVQGDEPEVPESRLAGHDVEDGRLALLGRVSAWATASDVELKLLFWLFRGRHPGVLLRGRSEGDLTRPEVSTFRGETA
jgi:hypothetical protein